MPIPEEEPLPPAVDETPNPFAHIVPVGDGDVMPLATGNGRTPAPHVNQRVVNYLARRFAARMVRAQYLSSRPAPFGVGYRDLLRIRLIGGILRELGIGTGKQDLKDCDVLYQGSYLTVHAHDVMITFGMVPSTYASVRSRLDLMHATYLWLDENLDQWEPTRRTSTEWSFWMTMRAFFGAERLPDRTQALLRPLDAASRDATQKGTWHWYTIAQAIYASFGLRRSSIPAPPELID